MTRWQRFRVPAGLVFGLAILYFSRPAPAFLTIGLVVATAGLALRIWAAGHLEKWQRLAISGPYRWTRNPLYLGSGIMGIGMSIASTRLSILFAFLVWFAVFYFPVMRREEQELQSSYGPEYEIYRKQVPLFLPSPWAPFRNEETSAGNFSWGRVISNREYNAVIGFLAVGTFLTVKMLST